MISDKLKNYELKEILLKRKLPIFLNALQMCTHDMKLAHEILHMKF